MQLRNNEQVASGSNVTIDVSCLPSREKVKCVLAVDGLWGEEDKICYAQPPNNCRNPHDRYRDRVRFTDRSELQIQDVRPDESGIYMCKTEFTNAAKLISGIIIVGKFLQNLFSL